MRTFIMIALMLVGAGTVSAQQPAAYNFSSPVQAYPAGYAPRPAMPAMQPGMMPTTAPMAVAPQPAYFNNAAGCDASGCDASGCDASGNVWNGGRRFGGLGSRLGNGGLGNGGCDSGNCGGAGCDSGNCGGAGCDGGNCGGGNGGGLLGGSMLGGLFNRCNGVGGASGCGVYHNLFGGFSSPSNMNFDSDPAFDLDLKDGWFVGRAWGRQLNCNWRGEIETSYRNNSASDFELSGSSLGLSGGKLNLLSGMVNIVRDIRPLGRFGELRPYFGAGAGVGFVDLEATLPGAPSTFYDSRDSTFVYQAFFGVSQKIRNCVDLYGEYRFFGTDEFCVETTPLNQPTGCDQGSLTQHNFLFGMRVWVR